MAKDMYKASLTNCENIKQTCERLFGDYNDLCKYAKVYKSPKVIYILRFVSIRMPKIRRFYKSISKFISDKDKYSAEEFIDKSVYYAIIFRNEYYEVMDTIMIFLDIEDDDNEMRRIACLHENPLILFMNGSFKREMINNYG